MYKDTLIETVVDYVLDAIPVKAYDLMKEKLSAKDFEDIIINGYVAPFISECMEVSREALKTVGTPDAEIILNTIDILDATPENVCRELKK